MRELGNAPLKVGARIQSPEAELGVVGMEVGMDGRGAKSSDAPDTDDPCVWQTSHLAAGGDRVQRLARDAARLDEHTLQKVSIGDVQLPGTGVTKENVSPQQLVWMKPGYFGSMWHDPKIEDLSPSDRLHGSSA